ncbi:unannotated protein [freshwater metagenome]|uniref:Unannotated protein n=1 Tax=freshwater metagenome TaxID=449393 RepID=A0A6J6HW79_9ZZZZ
MDGGQTEEENDDGPTESLPENTLQNAGLRHRSETATGEQGGLHDDHPDRSEQSEHGGDAHHRYEFPSVGPLIVEKGQKEREAGGEQGSEIHEEPRDGARDLPPPVGGRAAPAGGGIDRVGTDPEQERPADRMPVGRQDPIGGDIGPVGEIGSESGGNGPAGGIDPTGSVVDPGPVDVADTEPAEIDRDRFAERGVDLDR